MAAPPPHPPASSRRPRVLLGLSGSVACVKAEALVTALSAFADVRVVATPAALRFLPASCASSAAAADESLQAASGADARAAAADGPAAQSAPRACLAGAPVSTDAAEWAAWRAVGDPVHHIALRRWADVALLAPLSANTLAKVAGGLCDNLLTCVARAWDFRKPILAAPAMNTAMWEHPLTARHLATLRELGVQVIPPISKRLACGDVGVGAMAEVGTLAAAVRAATDALRLPPPGADADGDAAAAELDAAA